MPVIRRISLFDELFFGYPGKGILRHGLLHFAVADVGVDLCGIELFVTENVLQHADIDVPAPVHKGRGSVTQLVHRHSAVAEARHVKIAVNDRLDRLLAYTPVPRA